MTSDDNLIHQTNWLKYLYDEHQKNSENIIANQTGCIGFDVQGKLLPYKLWAYDKIQTRDPNECFNDNLVFPVGAGGIKKL